MSGPKVTVIGAGSFFFGKEVIRNMATSEVMAGGTLALVDTDRRRLATMMKIAERVFRKTRCGVRSMGSTDYKEVIEDSDFIVLSFSVDNMRYRGLDVEIAEKHGIRLCSADTIGPAGIFRSLRELPRVLDIAHYAAKVASHAWVINYVNPTAVMGIALMRYAPDVRSFALCDAHHEPNTTLGWLKMAGILPWDANSVPPEVQARLDLVIAGVNHFNWMLRFRYDGEDMMPKLRNVMQTLVEVEKQNPSEESKARYNIAYSLKLFDIFGAYPTLTSHTKEYVPFFQGYGVAPVQPEPLRLFDARGRQEEMDEAWKVNEKYASGKLSVKHFLENVGGEHATDIIESMWGGLGKQFYINTSNRGVVTNLPDDAFLELRCDVDMQGPRPQPVGPFPTGLRSLQYQILDTHELTAWAAVTGDRAILRRAMLTDPLCNNIEDADACMNELLKAQKDALPGYWFK